MCRAPKSNRTDKSRNHGMPKACPRQVILSFLVVRMIPPSPHLHLIFKYILQSSPLTFHFFPHILLHRTDETPPEPRVSVAGKSRLLTASSSEN
ncbi:hypothetical protein L2E82_49678 [Cichorium intybus]|uniref:Uncharacterized protein n=1 Tax=Cichorium intybus TaxID=13427 RepID=A0ACB8Z190_CICIN|nr:hypothetical protein L2E82_49678 [Cichorium intybus]